MKNNAKNANSMRITLKSTIQNHEYMRMPRIFFGLFGSIRSLGLFTSGSKEDGYIAITTAIIVSFIILIISATLGSSALLSRMNELDFSYKKITYYVSRSCLDYALLKLANDINYAGDETVPIGSYSCVLSAIENSGDNKIIRARVQDSFSGATTNLKLTLNRYDLTTILLEEPVSF